jgi:glycosyltransferase involved in cell wall biosynthesis
LGFPPYRTGGLTKYSFDLMQAQVERGESVVALWPGEMKFTSSKVSIKKKKNVEGIINFELINPLPVPLDEGIVDVDAYMKSCDETVFTRFLTENRPDVIHIHTLMGLYEEFITAANKLKIRIVFTTHDYFGICPKVTLYKDGNVCAGEQNCTACVACNKGALSMKKIMLMQSPVYRFLKDSFLVKRLRQRHRSGFFEEEVKQDVQIDKEELLLQVPKYQKLRAFYIGMLSRIDYIHFNSTITEKVYRTYFTPKAGKVLSITHKNISDKRDLNPWNPGSKLRITCLAPAKPFKGFLLLKEALDELWESEDRNFELKLYSPVKNLSEYMKVQEDGFRYEQLEQIFSDTDILVAPSIWYETFGFTVLEALSYGVPVIVSDHVGAKDIVGGGGIIVEAGSKEALKNAIQSLSIEKMQKLRETIKKEITIKSWDQFLEENMAMYEVNDFEDRICYSEF